MRPRIMRNGRSYDPQFEEKQATKKVLSDSWKAPHPIEGPLKLMAIFSFGYPKGWTKKRKAGYANESHVIKPDIDNLLKFYLDCMNEIIICDDKQVVEIFAHKRYCDHEGETLLRLGRPHV